MPTVNKFVIPLWILGFALVARHLGFSRFACGLLACYSLPFLVLAVLPIPRRPSPARYIVLAAFALVLGANLYVPIRPLLPGYRPKALEDVGYMFLPFFEIGLIWLFFLVGWATDLLCRKSPKP
jgi:hypothetical protein